MAKSIELYFPKRGVRIPAILLEQEAPKTCDAVWSVLGESDNPDSVKGWPKGGMSYHAKFVGPEIFTFLPKGEADPPTENVTYRPIPGDVMLFLIPESRHPLIPYQGSLWDFAVFYDRGGNLKTEVPGIEDLGAWDGSRFAKVPNSHLDELLDVGNKIYRDGTEIMLVRRLKS